MLDYAVRKADAPKSASPATLVMLHGYGADESDLFSIAEYFDPTILSISLRAPIALPISGFGWYNLTLSPTARGEGVHGYIEDSASRIESERTLLEELPKIVAAENGSMHNLYLMGFSQGAVMCYSLIGRRDVASLGWNIKGIIPLSGYIPRDALDLFRNKRFDGLDFFIGHGEYDDLIPAAASDEAINLLTNGGATVASKFYPIGHGISPEEIADVAHWLSGKLASEPTK